MNLKRRVRKVGIVIVTLVVGAAIGLMALIYLEQDRLIFFPPAAPGASPESAGLTIREVDIATGDANSLRGWLARPAGMQHERLPLAIYFGGNAEEVSYMAGLASRLPGWSLLAVNYRGYGGNSGNPSERALCADALAIYDWAARRPDVDPARIAAIGRSLGSGVAVYLATERPIAALVLVTPYDSLRAVAGRHYPFLPVSLLLKHPFDSIGRASRISTPVLVLAAGRDDIIPSEHAQALFARWHGPKIWREFSGAGHNDIDADSGYYEAIAAFLSGRK